MLGRPAATPIFLRRFLVGTRMEETDLPEVAAESWVSVLMGQRPGRSEVPDIGTLVQGHIDRTGDSLRKLTDRSGGRVAHSYWDRLLKNTIKEFPRPESIEAIAAGLSLPESVVLLAIGKTLGVDVSSHSVPGIPLPAGAEDLDDRGRRAVWDMVIALLPPVTASQARMQVRRRTKSSEPEPPD